MKRRILFLLAIFLNAGFLFGAVQANEQTVIVTEIAAHESTGLEWIEVQNVSNSSVDLADWGFFENGSNHSLNLVAGSSTLYFGEVAIIAQDAQKIIEMHGGQANIFDSSWGSLKMSGEEIGLKNESGEIVEQFEYPQVFDSSLQRACIICDPGVSTTWQTLEFDSFAVGLDFVIKDVPETDPAPTTTSEIIELPDVNTTSTTSTVQIVDETATTTISTTTQQTETEVEQNQSQEEEIEVVQPVSYAPGVIVINEFVSNPADGSVEFIELKNKTTLEINLDGWWIEDEANKKTILNGSISQIDYFVIEKPKGRLNNSGDSIYLFDPSGVLIDSVIYGDDELESPKKGESASLIAGAFVISLQVTRGAENVLLQIQAEIEVEEQNNIESKKVEKKSDTQQKEEQQNTEDQKEVFDYSDIIISEIFPNPEGKDDLEFIEILNIGESAVNINGLLFDDSAGGSKAHAIEYGLIEPAQYLFVLKEDTGISLNNSGDSARLIDSNQKVIYEIVYENSKEGYSYAIDIKTQLWNWTTSTTPGRENVFSFEGDLDDSVLSRALTDLTDIEDGQVIQTVGTVSALPGVYGSQYFYIVDTSLNFGIDAGIQVYQYQKDFPELRVGDVVQIKGELTTTKQGRRLKVKSRKDISVIAKNKIINPKIIEIQEIDNSMVGIFVKVSGEATQVTSKRMFIDDGTDEIEVYLKKGTGVKKFDVELGDDVSISGTISMSSAGLQILPRSEDDIVLDKEPETQLDLESTIIEHNTSSITDSGLAKKYSKGAAGGVGSLVIAVLAKFKGRKALSLVAKLLKK